MPRKKKQRARRAVTGSAKRTGALERRVGNAYPVAFRQKVVEEALRDDVSWYQLAQVFGISEQTIKRWVDAYETGGVEALIPQPAGWHAQQRRQPASPAREVEREAVLAVKQEHPEFGTRRIRDVLRRFEALGVSEQQVRRILHEEGLVETPKPAVEREHPERRWERAEPNQLWQSDIFTFLLRRHERLYLTVFMDDHSRFIVGHALAHRQRSELVLEALERGIAGYGAPREVLTDNGRQYTAWRGKTAFEQTLRQEGIDHIKSRPHHPQTLGKVERFWKTLWDEFLSRTVFADFADCQRRLGLFIDGYNFQRPHQALDGLVPADRFFRAAPQVRDAVEQAVEQNAVSRSLQRPKREPFYLVGRLGDRDLSIAASGEGLRIQLDGQEPKTIPLTKENADEEEDQREDRAHASPYFSSVASCSTGSGPSSMPTRREGAGANHACEIQDLHPIDFSQYWVECCKSNMWMSSIQTFGNVGNRWDITDFGQTGCPAKRICAVARLTARDLPCEIAVMNPRTLTLALGQIGITVLFLQEIACSGGERSDGADEDANEIETVSQSILNGPQTVNPQVVDLGGCTGTLLTPEWVLTARHCVPNKLWTAGTLTDLDADRVNRGVHLPAGKTGSNVIEVAVNKTASQTAGDQLKMYFSDGTCTLWSWPYGPWPTGSLELDATCNFLSALPGGRTPSQIVGITSTQTPGQTPTMYVYFNDGWYASGADPNLGGLTLIGQYTMDVAHNPSNILSMALNQSNQTYTWFDDGTRSVGTYGDLDATSTPTAYSGPAQAGSVANIRGIGIRLNGASVRTYYNVNGAIHTSQGGSFDLDSMFDGVPVKGATGASTTNGPGATGGDAGEIAQDTDVRGIAISKTTSKVYTWHRNGVVSVGDSIRLDLYNKAYPFSPPLNYTPDQLVGVGISMNSERVYYWWNNGWRTWGTSSDATSNGAWYTLPPGYSISQIAAIDIDQNDRIQVFYTDGKYSTGTSTDFDAYTAPTPYSLSSATGFNLTTSDLLEVAINSSGRVHAWYRSKPKTIISNASGSSESRSTVGWINFWSPDLDASMLRVSPAFTTVAPAYRLSPSPIYTAVGTSLTCYGYGGAFVLEWTSQPVSVGSWIDSFDPYLGPVMGANYAITPNGLGQTTEPGDSGGPCMASLGTATVLAGVHHTAPLPGGGNPSQDTMAIHIGKWALERGVHYVEQVRTPRILCHAVQCFSAPDPMPTNSTFPTVNWNPCNGGSFSWYASIETTSPDYVRIGATSYSGATSPSGTASGTLSVFAQSYGSGTSKGLKNLYATCN